MSIFERKPKEVTENITETKAQSLGERIAELRKLKGYTQEEFSSLLDITPQAVSKWENDISCPDITLLPKIAGIFGITVDELLTGSKKREEVKDEKKEIKNMSIDKLKLVINVLKPNQKPIKVTLPFAIVKRFAKVGVGISGIVGNNVINNKQIDEILSLVDEGVTGTVLDVVTEDETNVIIEIV